MVSQDIPAYMLTFKNGVLDVAEEYQKKLTDDEIIRVERARELIDIQNQINEEQKKFFTYTETWVDSINKKLGEFIGEKGRDFGGRRTLSKGGLLSGPSHNNGGIGGYLNGQPIELEGGEYIINKKAVANYGIPLFDALNARKFQNGGMAAGLLWENANKRGSVSSKFRENGLFDGFSSI
jgi:hypothetical protein